MITKICDQLLGENSKNVFPSAMFEKVVPITIEQEM